MTNCTVLDVAVSTGREARRHDSRSSPRAHDWEHPAVYVEGTLTVRTAGLDELVARGALRPPAVVKCDVEGAEHDVLRGAETILAT